MVMYICNPSIQKAKAGNSQIPGQCRLQRESEVREEGRWGKNDNNEKEKEGKGKEGRIDTFFKSTDE